MMSIDLTRMPCCSVLYQRRGHDLLPAFGIPRSCSIQFRVDCVDDDAIMQCRRR